MKNVLKSILVICVTAAIINSIFFVKSLINPHKPEQDNERTMVAQAIELNDDVLILRTSDGNEWEWGIEKGEHFQKNGIYNVRFDTLGTPGIRDDIILWIEER